MTFFLQNLVNALQWGSFYALIALGYSMVYGVLMLFNFAHGDVFMVGSYIGLLVSSILLALGGLGSLGLPAPVRLQKKVLPASERSVPLPAKRGRWRVTGEP